MKRFLRIGLAALVCGWVPGATKAAPLVGMSQDQAKSHWAFQPLRSPAIPAVRARDRVQTPVDAFVLAHLEASGGSLPVPADPRALIRRVT